MQQAGLQITTSRPRDRVGRRHALATSGRGHNGARGHEGDTDKVDVRLRAAVDAEGDGRAVWRYDLDKKKFMSELVVSQVQRGFDVPCGTGRGGLVARGRGGGVIACGDGGGVVGCEGRRRRGLEDWSRARGGLRAASAEDVGRQSDEEDRPGHRDASYG